MKLWTADTETAGLFGPIRLMGWYDGETYRETTDPMDFWDAQREADAVCYFHNLDFDLGKLLPRFAAAAGGSVLDYAKRKGGRGTFIRQHKFLRAAFRGCGVTLADSMALLPAGLEKLCRDFGVPAELAKADLTEAIAAGGYKSKDDYFKRVPVDDPVYRDYLKKDVLSLHWLLTRLMEISGLDEDTFIAIPTVAALAMKVFKTRYPDDYDTMIGAYRDRKGRKRATHLTEEAEALVREGLRGGRTEKFRTTFDAGDTADRLYHYDMNSMYPTVMHAEEYPVGRAEHYTGPLARAAWKRYTAGKIPACMVRAEVTCPASMYYPILPTMVEGRVVFPTGRFSGVWPGPELEYALEMGYTLHTIEEGIYWRQTAPIFREFVEDMYRGKLTTRGAEKEFYKNVLNNLFGKTGMRRELPAYVSPAQWEELRAKDPERQGRTFRHVQTGEEFVETLTTVYADYIQPHVAAHVTAYARIELHRQLMACADPHYTDTDSLVDIAPFAPEDCDANALGKWKLEGIVKSARYLQPKFYAELLETGEEVRKSKGLIKEFRDTVRYADYVRYTEELSAGRDVVLYGNVPQRLKLLSALKMGVDPDTRAYASKAIRAGRWSKRREDWQANRTYPWDYAELHQQLSAKADARDEARWARAIMREERQRIWRTIMPRGIRDQRGEYPDLPRHLKRQEGWGLDVWGAELGMTADELYEEIKRIYL